MANDQPIIPLGTMVTAFAEGANNDGPDAPTKVPDFPLTGPLSGYYVKPWDYFKYIVAGYDVDPSTMHEATSEEIQSDDV